MMPAWHHSEYSTPICPLTKSTIKKTIYSNAGLCQNIKFMDRINMHFIKIKTIHVLLKRSIHKTNPHRSHSLIGHIIQEL